MATLLTFRLDRDTRERVRARLKRDGLTLSAVVTRGLHEYVSARAPAETGSRVRELPDQVVVWLRELRAAGRSQALSAALAELNRHGWPLDRLAQALGVSKQAVQARVRRAGRAIGDAADSAPASLHSLVPAIARRRPPAAGPRPHLTVRIDQGLRTAAHRVAADEGASLSQVVETILHRYLRASSDAKDLRDRYAFSRPAIVGGAALPRQECGQRGTDHNHSNLGAAARDWWIYHQTG
jgi:antitoxin component of RelBE/YafQ-DinJ toxin-antitoxin module